MAAPSQNRAKKKNIYDKLLSTERFRTSTVSDRHVMLEAESDRGRLLFCPAFRRLQQKAQVFSMEPNAAVRSRLTHSFEVSQMGRYIADQISIRMRRARLATDEQCSALVAFVETACLMHDIGNPPFGHFGEAAISEWFRRNGPELIISACANGRPRESFGTGDPRIMKALADFESFDGNPQGLRVVAKLQRNSDEYGLNLTKTTLASYLKYVRGSADEPAAILSPFTKKCGFFETERSIVEGVWSHFGYSAPQRFPLAYIMEAADDIAYCISDLEDSIEKGLLDHRAAFVELSEQWEEIKFSRSDKEAKKIGAILRSAAKGIENKKTYTYTDFRTALNRLLVGYCAEIYVSKHAEVLSGTLPSIIPADSSAGKVLELLKDYCRTKVYCHEVVQRVELAGYTAIYGLLEKFAMLLSCNFDRFQRSLDYSVNKDADGHKIVIEKKLLKLFPKNYIKTYQDDLKKLPRRDKDFTFMEWSLRAHLIVDYISGMTDDFAMTTYRTLSGMRL